MYSAVTLSMWARMMSSKRRFLRENGQGVHGQQGKSFYVFNLITWDCCGVVQCVAVFYISFFFKCLGILCASMYWSTGLNFALCVGIVTKRSWRWRKKQEPQLDVSHLNSLKGQRHVWWLAVQQRKLQYLPNHTSHLHWASYQGTPACNIKITGAFLLLCDRAVFSYTIVAKFF